MLADYADSASTRGSALEASALRSESLEMREILAYLASNRTQSRQEIEQQVLEGRLAHYNPVWLAKLARVSALQNFLPTDVPFARAALKLANPYLRANASPTLLPRKLEVELAYADGDFEEAKRLVDTDSDLKKIYYNFLSVDLLNPYTESPFADHEAWIEGINAPLRAHKIEPVAVTAGPENPFDRLCSPLVPPGGVDGPLVTVVMASYKPDSTALMTSLTSILNQTWSNLQVLVVDDASGPEYTDLLDRLESADPRVETIRLGTNGGAYLARNAGIRAARGEFICGQDADDWSHPRRIETQVQELLADDERPAVRVAGINTSEHLVRTRVGYNPESRNASSLMFRAHLARELGGYAPARKAADNEFHLRLEQYTGHSVAELKAPLTFIRIVPQSLSRSDFRAGWSHPARRAFKSAYTHWHGTASREELPLGASAVAQPFPVPHQYQVDARTPDALDIVYAGDWRQYAGPQKSIMEEISAAIARGYRVGILHLEAARFLSTTTEPLCAPIQDLINRGAVTQILQDDEVSVNLIILRCPPILQFPPYRPFAIHAKQLIILADQAPWERDGSDIRYVVDDCAQQAERLFGVRGLWVPQDPAVRATIENEVPERELAAFDMPGILDLSEWETDAATPQRAVNDAASYEAALESARKAQLAERRARFTETAVLTRMLEEQRSEIAGLIATVESQLNKIASRTRTLQRERSGAAAKVRLLEEMAERRGRRIQFLAEQRKRLTVESEEGLKKLQQALSDLDRTSDRERALRTELERTKAQLSDLRASRSWRITRPLRWVQSAFRSTRR